MAQGRARRDLWICILVGALLIVLATWLDLGERWVAWSRAYENWEIDELPLALALGALALGWFSSRRWQEADRERGRSDRFRAELNREREAHRKTAEQLQLLVERFEAMARSAKLGYYIWDLVEDRCVYCSEEYASLHGMTVAEYMANNAAFADDSQMIHPEDLSHYIKSVQESRSNFEILDVEFRIVTKSGEVRHLRDIEHMGTVVNGKQTISEGTIQDISDLKRSETLLMHAMNASAQMFALYDPQDRLVTANAAYKALYGSRGVTVEPGESYKRLQYDAAAKDGIDKAPAHIQDWLKGRLDRRRAPAKGAEFQTPEGQWYEVTDIVLDDGHVLTLVGDITDRKEMEAHLGQAQRMEAVGKLTSGLAHDFNNLLGIILGNAELLAETEESSPDQVFAILQASQRGAQLTHRLLAFSRQQPLRPRTVDLSRLIGNLMPQLTEVMGSEVQVRRRIAPDLWPVLTDPGELEKALLNLAGNARKAMPDGGRLTLDCSNLSREACRADRDLAEQDYLRIVIADSGVGMEPEVLSRAFEPFFTTDKSAQSSGLGLSMVYGFAKQSGGSVTLESEPGCGSRATLLLPRAAEAAESLPAPHREPDEAIPAGNGELILLLDDSSPVRTMVQAQLHRLGYRTREAESASAALAALAQEQVALAMVDIVLADGASGLAFVAEAKQSHPDLKVIYMSGYSAEVAGLEPESRLLSKPFRRQELARALRTALD